MERSRNSDRKDPDLESPVLYHRLASWWPLLSAPEEYAEEAGVYFRVLTEACEGRIDLLLELGSGGGNNASHLKAHFRLTLVDRSAEMLAVSRKLNPECEHVQADMRRVRLRREFDAVLVHDAISYINTESDLRQVFETAYIHCRPGGVALFAPDHVRETFQPGTSCGGNDGARRGMRYLEWTWDPDPDDTTYTVDFAFLLRHEDGSTSVARDRHILGLFPRAEWLRLLWEVGFDAESVPFAHSAFPGRELDMFVGRRRGV